MALYTINKLFIHIMGIILTAALGHNIGMHARKYVYRHREQILLSVDLWGRVGGGCRVRKKRGNIVLIAFQHLQHLLI